MKNKLPFILSALVCIVLSIILFNTIKDKSQLEKKVNNLQQAIDNLEQKNESLVQENDELAQSLQQLNYENAKENLTNKYNRVRRGISSGSTRIMSANVIETQIDGEFEGWEGETIFKMMNGTIWQQAEYDYTYHYAYMPDVLIYRKGGSYYMKVEDVDEEIRVVQIK